VIGVVWGPVLEAHGGPSATAASDAFTRKLKLSST
jgi:hypothetical protein